MRRRKASANIAPTFPAYKYYVANFWRNPGIVTLLDPDAQHPRPGGADPRLDSLQPVNWRGDGQEFALLSANIREGGMIDGQMRRVVMFPDDGHPDLASQVADLTGDSRDEIILWDQQRVWIYTQDRPFTGTNSTRPSATRITTIRITGPRCRCRPNGDGLRLLGQPNPLQQRLKARVRPESVPL